MVHEARTLTHERVEFVAGRDGLVQSDPPESNATRHALVQNPGSCIFNEPKKKKKTIFFFQNIQISLFFISIHSHPFRFKVYRSLKIYREYIRVVFLASLNKPQMANDPAFSHENQHIPEALHVTSVRGNYCMTWEVVEYKEIHLFCFVFLNNSLVLDSSILHLRNLNTFSRISPLFDK